MRQTDTVCSPKEPLVAGDEFINGTKHREEMLCGPLVNWSPTTALYIHGFSVAVKAVGDENNLPTVNDGETVTEMCDGLEFGASVFKCNGDFLCNLPVFNLNTGDKVFITWVEPCTEVVQ